MQQLIYTLNETDDVHLVGGKAGALKQLITAGFNVPNGFIISIDAANMLTPKLEDMIYSSFDKLNTGFVAVRSSGLHEDSTAATWAGQFDTFLNVDRDSLLESIEKCWKSTQSKRASAYADHAGSTPSKIAVLVQVMVRSEISGIGFSVHPVSQDHGSMVIEATLGLGDAIVSGQVTPDTYVLNKDRLQVIEKHIVRQPKLSDRQLKDVSNAVIALEQLCGHPVDVEWAFAKNTLYILQCRPISTLS